MACTVSVILPALSDCVPVQRALNSIRRQTLPGIEVISAVAVDVQTQAAYDNLIVCHSFEQAMERAGGAYTFFMHPEGILAPSVLQRLNEAIGAYPLAVCESAVRFDGGAFRPPNDADALVHAGLFRTDVVRGVIQAANIGAMELDMLPQYMHPFDRAHVDGVLVYIDGVHSMAASTPPEMAAMRVRQYTAAAKRNVETGRSARNFALYKHYIRKYFVYFHEIMPVSEPRVLSPLYDALRAYIRFACACDDLMYFIGQVTPFIDARLFALPYEAFSLLPPPVNNPAASTPSQAAAPSFGTLPSAQDAVMRDVLASLALPGGACDAATQFAQGRAGLKTLLRCFIMWLNYKLGGRQRHE